MTTGHPHAGGEIGLATEAARTLPGPSPRGWGNRHPEHPVGVHVRAIPTRVGKSRPPRRDGPQRAGHPHAGGEIAPADQPAPDIVGPSPRGWGNQIRDRSQPPGDRAIPTRVGKSEKKSHFVQNKSGHPHAGGEISPSSVLAVTFIGPSPRGWGNRERHHEGGDPLRAIPTRVGKSWTRGHATRCRSGHPHAGGEIRRRTRGTRCQNGPSPRGWGNRGGGRSPARRSRAIPTRVGKSGSCAWSRWPCSGHPHAGGEILLAEHLADENNGPSPRGWGNRFFFFHRSVVPRAIPTRVGKSFPTPRKPVPPTGHPHAGGEIPADQVVLRPWFGPSPRGWGNLPLRKQSGLRIRAIPTRVGKSTYPERCRDRAAGHPHAGGEITSAAASRILTAGPSPRGWGNRSPPPASGAQSRAIPTRVGKSKHASRGRGCGRGHPHAGGEIRGR